MSKKLISLFLSFNLLVVQSGFAQGIAEVNLGQYLGQMRSNLAQDKFRPLHLRYLSYDPAADNFQLLLDKGDDKDIDVGNGRDRSLQEKTKVLMEYFQIGLALPNDKFWVNLRPDAQDQIIDPELEKTDLGKVMLEADLQLKKDTANFTSPQSKEGREYWDKLYQEARELFGSEPANIPTITRPWIVPGEIIVREGESSAYIFKANLKVMLEEDYLVGNGRDRSLLSSQQYNFKDPRMKELNTYSTQLIKELIIPKLTKEVNTSKRYAALRQVFFSLVLARWFKERFKQSQVAGHRSQENAFINLIDSKNLTNLTSKEPWSKSFYFNEYKKSFEKGEYNLKETLATPSGQVIRSYVSGGTNFTGVGSPLIKDGFKKLLKDVKDAYLFFLWKIPEYVYYIVDHSKGRWPISLKVGYIPTPKEPKLVSLSITEQNYNKPEDIRLPDEKSAKTGKELAGKFKPILFNWSDLENLRESLGDRDAFVFLEAILRGNFAPSVVSEEFSSKFPHIDISRFTGEGLIRLLYATGALKYVQGSEVRPDSGSSPLNLQEEKKQIWDAIDEFKKSLSPKRDEFDSLIEENSYWEKDSRVEEMKEFFKKTKQAIQTHQGPISGAPSLKDLIMGKNLFDYGALGNFVASLISIHHDWSFAIVNFDESLKSEQEKILRDIREIAADANKKLEEFYEKLRKIKWNIEKTLFSLPAEPKGASSSLDKFGGIDFTHFNTLYQPIGSFHKLNYSLPTLSSSALQRIDLDKELKALRNMASSGILPSGRRVKEYEAALFQKGRFEEKQDDLLVCLAEIYLLAEKENINTGPELQESLVIADTGRFVLLPNNQKVGLN